MRPYGGDHSGSPWRFRLLADCVGLALLLGALGLLAGCPGGSSEKAATDDVRKKFAAQVTVGKAVEKTAPLELRASGIVHAHATVYVKARVTGRLTSVHFKEGGRVGKGDLLFSMDTQTSEAKLRRARAALARHAAHWRSARNEVENYGFMLKKGYVAKARYDEVVAAAAALEADVKVAEAVVEGAMQELKDCSIHSPMDGVAGELLVDEGNVVEADKDSLVVINRMDPVYVSFSIPEASLPLLRTAMSGKTVEVRAIVGGEEDRPVAGELAFMDNKVDSETGAIGLKGTFPNESGILWPGQSVGIRLTVASGSESESEPESGAGAGTGAGAMVVVPSQAVLTGPEGQYVYVVKPDHTVEPRPVTVGGTPGGETVIAKGVGPGEMVVLDGREKLVSGSMVEILGGE